MRLAVQEVQRAVERIDDEAVGLVSPFHNAALFHDEAIAGAGLHQVAIDHIFGAVIRVRDEIGRPLSGDLQVFNFAKVARKAAPSGARSGDHDCANGGGFRHEK